MSSLSLSLFSRLYLSIILVLAMTTGITFYLSQYWAEQDAENDFLRDSQISLSTIKQQAFFSKLSIQEYINQHQHIFHFDVYWLSENDTVCRQCQLLNQHPQYRLYQTDDGEFLVQFLMELDSGSLIIQDRNELAEDDEEASILPEPESDPEDWLPILVIFSSLVAMGLGLYYPIRQLQSRIKGLNQVQQQFGQGQLNIRADVNLPAPLNELAQHFNAMAQNIEQTVTENQIFAQAVPHELRTPLSRIQLAAGILASTKQTPENLALLNNIDTYIEDINDLIKQLLVLAKLNQSQDDPNNRIAASEHSESIELAHFINERIQALSKPEHVTVQCNIPANSWFSGEQSYLRLVIDNLISNAFRYCHQEVNISILQNEAHYQINIEDDGDGIKAQDFDKIFLPFSRLDKSRTKATGGLGLGLAIAQAASKRLQGKLEVEDSTLGGAKFSLCLDKT